MKAIQQEKYNIPVSIFLDQSQPLLDELSLLRDVNFTI
jgi:hypothetical protein